VVMIAPKSQDIAARVYVEGRGVPALIAIHQEPAPARNCALLCGRIDRRGRA